MEKTDRDLEFENTQFLQENKRLLDKNAFLEEQLQKQELVFYDSSEETLQEGVQRGLYEPPDHPYIYSASWMSWTYPGAQCVFAGRIGNPQNKVYRNLVLSLFFGFAELFDDIGQALSSGRDPNWPCLSTPPFSIGPEAPEWISKKVYCTIPPNIAPSTYYGNFILWQLSSTYSGETAALLSRKCFPLTVRHPNSP